VWLVCEWGDEGPWTERFPNEVCVSLEEACHVYLGEPLDVMIEVDIARYNLHTEQEAQETTIVLKPHPETTTMRNQ
jgi:hypothetical protein